MKNAENVYEKIAPISIRLSADGKDKLIRLQKESGCKSQKEFIETLLQLYETGGRQKLSNESSSTIKLILQNNNWITRDADQSYKEAESLIFEGVCIYAPQQPNKINKLSVLSHRAIDSIKKDLFLPEEIDVEKYLIQDTLYAYYSYTAKRYIVIEYFYIYQFLNENEVLNMYRDVNGTKISSFEVGNMLVSKHNRYEINDFSEFLSMVKPYMSTSDIINIDFFVKKHKIELVSNK